MGLFSTFSSKPSADVSGGASFRDSGSRRLSPREVGTQVRRDLHKKLGGHTGEEVFNILNAHSDRDSAFGAKGISGKEIDGMLGMLRANHRDNLSSSEINDVEAILREHFND
ncbi:MAG: hypothetical protein WA082_00660 [Candidatus Moraniibacteriota bacterium]